MPCAYVCPPALKAGFDALVRKVEQGDDLRPHLSTLIRKPDLNDPLLNDWGVHHFHLGTTLEPSGFVQRTGPLLFALVRPDDFHIIGVFEHGEWTRDDIVEVLHSNWPQVLARWRAGGVKRAGDPWNANRRKAFRKAGLYLPTETRDGTVYVLLGGGYVSSGASLEALRRSDRTRTAIRVLQEDVLRRAGELAERARALGCVVGDALSFTLGVGDDGHALVRLNCDPPFSILTSVKVG